MMESPPQTPTAPKHSPTDAMAQEMASIHSNPISLGESFFSLNVNANKSSRS